jgi:hypothetical protein
MISVLVPFKSFGDCDRDANWRWVEDRFHALHPDWEICVGESEQPFNRGQAINEAASKAKGDIFYVSDADCFVYPEQATECVRLASEAPGVVIAATRWLALERAFSWEVRVGRPDVRFASEPPTWCEVQGTVSGCFAISRESFEKVGGFPKEFMDWGGEDCAFWYKMETFVAQGRRLEGDMFHLWHPTARDENSDRFKVNMNRMNQYGEANLNPEKMRELI